MRTRQECPTAMGACATPPLPLQALLQFRPGRIEGELCAEVPLHLRKQCNQFLAIAEGLGDATPGDGAFPFRLLNPAV